MVELKGSDPPLLLPPSLIQAAPLLLLLCSHWLKLCCHCSCFCPPSRRLKLHHCHSCPPAAGCQLKPCHCYSCPPAARPCYQGCHQSQHSCTPTCLPALCCRHPPTASCHCCLLAAAAVPPGPWWGTEVCGNAAVWGWEEVRGQGPVMGGLCLQKPHCRYAYDCNHYPT